MSDNREIDALFDRLDERYVQQKECAERKEEVNKRFANDDKRIALVDHRLHVIERIALVIASSVIAQLALSFFQLLMR